ncbi:RloB family protein [Archangium sp.]|uniref:RloB family protein n=1 Tax=Archangium sp. TaxID=1872627 RepID=UPI002D2E00EF|nr:RloB family protein [Archangium sp.]HYO51384.1 RloB family protein [Archangium sp.]
MVSRRRHDERSIRRRGPTREPKRRILIVCEGQETERGYFKGFQHEVRNPRVHVEVAGETGEPLQVVQVAVRRKDEAASEARQQRDENLRWDEVWGVFDVDEHARLDAARQLARKNGIDLAISNPCFELWALLHFQEQQAHIERDKAKAALQRHLPGYDKALDFARLHPGYSEAVRRAQRLDEDAERQEKPGRNPTTGVYRLTESIRQGGGP